VVISGRNAKKPAFDPFLCGQVPLNMASRAGTHTGVVTCARSKRMPSSANRSMWGVMFGIGLPKAPAESQFMSSVVIIRTFGESTRRPLGAANGCPAASAAAPAPAAFKKSRRVFMGLLG
jgi:hypothetical protein